MVDHRGLPNVYQTHPPEALRRKASGGFFFVSVFGAGLPEVYQGDFWGGKAAVFSDFFLFFARFRRCNGRYAPLAQDTWTEGDLTYEPYGRIVLSPCSWETCAYTARYTAKKSNTFFPQFFESFGLEAPFTLMSRRPGIAGQYYQDHPEVYDYRYINIPGQEGGIKFTVPRYFDRLLEKEDPEALARMKEIRQKIVTELDKEKDTKTTYGTKNRLEVEARQKEAVAKMLRRSAI